MSAHIYGPRDWLAARNKRALAGKAPKPAVRRFIMLRQRHDGGWSAAIYTWRYGRWLSPEWLCGTGSLVKARDAARDAWMRMRMPAVWHYAGETGMRALRFGQNEPMELVA